MQLEKIFLILHRSVVSSIFENWDNPNSKNLDEKSISSIEQTLGTLHPEKLERVELDNRIKVVGEHVGKDYLAFWGKWKEREKAVSSIFWGKRDIKIVD